MEMQRHVSLIFSYPLTVCKNLRKVLLTNWFQPDYWGTGQRMAHRQDATQGDISKDAISLFEVL